MMIEIKNLSFSYGKKKQSVFISIIIVFMFLLVI